ncbi:hypothetical protein HETIRDRAFT_425732 [Heterobasidion irregulare TC 32-1]|uniref:Uncharacterized protein n=1 Tax=Heterobasidion irregulare (strain TC 32-1) TaxID=747525 RepID=W4KH18_HETIT|nr:uncharacterized protein HETIRDRAFT_425732 [Heterobasidion irregulare TC 32-1]ETW84326.1 hypothetical protein HETIRDRAFT_425732 [Heterobasidion irregulare TC 32-1]
MSSVSFPNSLPSHASSSSSPLDGSYYPTSFEGMGNSGFQMNPHSAHPPRTPRTSIISPNASVYTPEVYTSHEEMEERPTDLEQEIDDDEDTAKVNAKARVRKEEIWREMLKTSNGRDKAFALITKKNRLGGRASQTLGVDCISRIEAQSRKCLILFNWLSPLTSIMAEHSAAPIYPPDRPSNMKESTPRPLLHTFLHAPPPVLLELVNAFADDIATFSKLGLLGKRTGDRAGRIADCCWFASTLVNLVENGVERSIILNSQREVESRLFADSMTGATAKSTPRNTKIDETELQRLQRQDHWLQMNRIKLIMDLMFVSYDVFKLKRGKDTVKTFTGLASAVLSSAKLYDRHRNVLVKNLTF